MRFLILIKAFFCSTSEETTFRVPYFWSTLLLSLMIVAVVQQLRKPGDALTGTIGVLGGLVGILLATYNQGKKGRDDDKHG